MSVCDNQNHFSLFRMYPQSVDTENFKFLVFQSKNTYRAEYTIKT